MGNDSYGIKLSVVDRIALDIKNLSKKKIDICIVIGGGNIFRGLAASAEGMDRAQADYMGMLATVLNSLALQNALGNQTYGKKTYCYMCCWHRQSLLFN